MYGMHKMKKGHTTNSRHREDMPHHMAPKSMTLMKQGKAIPTGQTKMNWTEGVGGQAAGTDSPGMARKRRTMKNRGQGTGMAGKGSNSRKFTMPKPNQYGYY